MSSSSNITHSTPSLNTQNENSSDAIKPQVSSLQDSITQLAAEKAFKNLITTQTTTSQVAISNNSFTEMKSFKRLNFNDIEKIVDEVPLKELSKIIYGVTKNSNGTYDTDLITSDQTKKDRNLLLILENKDAYLTGNQEELAAFEEYSYAGGKLIVNDKNQNLLVVDPSTISCVVVPENFNRLLIEKVQTYLRNQENHTEHKENSNDNINYKPEKPIKENNKSINRTGQDVNSEKQKDYNDLIKLKLFFYENARFFENLTEILSQIKRMKKRAEQKKENFKTNQHTQI